MKGKFVQTESGNLTVLSVGDDLVIWADDKCYIVRNPDSPLVTRGGVCEVDSTTTPEEIKHTIDLHFSGTKA